MYIKEMPSPSPFNIMPKAFSPLISKIQEAIFKIKTVAINPHPYKTSYDATDDGDCGIFKKELYFVQHFSHPLTLIPCCLNQLQISSPMSCLGKKCFLFLHTLLRKLELYHLT